MRGVSGFAYKTELDSSKENIINLGEPDLGAASNNIMHLARIIPCHTNSGQYFDNFYVKSLGCYLAKEGILRRNCIDNCELPPPPRKKNVDHLLNTVL